MLLKAPNDISQLFDTFNARIELIVLNGLKTLKLRSEDKFTD
jgi:hypothetical protein